MVKSSYENLSKFLNYRTSNMGMITLTDELLGDKNIFSYITKDGIEINNNIENINKISDIAYAKNTANPNDKEDIIMKTLVFNDTLLDNNDISQKACQHIIRSGTEPNSEKYTIGDFSDNITFNIGFYKENFNRVNNERLNYEEITDIDLSYYASQDVIKSLFLIDVLSQIYGEIARNKDNRESILNNLRNLTIKSRYYIDDNNIWKLYPDYDIPKNNYYNITFSEKLYPQDRDAKTGNIIPDQVSVIEIKNVSIDNEALIKKITTDTVNTMISLFKPVIKKHIDFIMKADMMYSDAYSNFYKLCRLMLNSVILNSISIIVDNNSKASTYNYLYNNIPINENEKCTYMFNGFEMTNNIDYNNGSFFYKNFLKLSIPVPKGSNSCAITNGDISYIIKNGAFNADEDLKFENINEVNTKKNENIDNLSNILNDNILSELQDVNVTIFGGFKNNNDGVILPFATNIEYSHNDIDTNINSKKLRLNIDTENKLQSISGLEIGNKYYIKLYNFNSFYSNDFSFTNNDIEFMWYNDTKLLIIVSINVQGLYTITESDDNKGKIYLCPIDISANTLKIPNKLSANKKISIHLPGCTDIKLNGSVVQSTAETAPYFDNHNKLLIIDGSINVPSYTLVYNTTFNCNNFIYNQDSIIKPKYIKIGYHFIQLALLYIFSYNRNVKPENRILNNFTVPKSDTPIISPLSYEKDSLIKNTHLDTTYSYNGLNNAENGILDMVLKNISDKISNNFSQDTKDNDAIIKSMSNLSTINKNLSKSSTVIKKNYNETTLESSKVLSTSGLFIACAIILVITVFASVYLPISGVSRTNAISISGFIFILAIVMYIIIKLLEKMKYNSYEESFINYSSYKGKINAILNNILSNLYNERTRISQQVIRPSIQKEENYFSEKNKKFEIYKGRTYSDLQIITRIRQKNIAKIDCMLEISIIISLALLLYILKPEWLNILLGVSIILIFISIFILFVKLTYVVQTNAKNKYWTKPDTSLDKLKYSGGLN